MTLETALSIPDMELELDDFSSSSKTTKKTYIMTKHVSKKVSSSVTSSSATSSSNANQKMSSLFNNDLANSIGFDNDDSTKALTLANIDMNKLGIDMDMGLNLGKLDMDLNLDMKSQLANMEKQMNTTSQKVMGISSSKKTSKSTSLSSTSSSSSSVQNSSNNTAASTSTLNSIQNSPACSSNSSGGPFIVKIPIGADVNPEDLQVALEENEGLSWMTIRAAQEKYSETANSKSASSFRIIKKFTIPSNVNTQAISSTFTYEGEQSILKIEAPILQAAIQQQDVPVAIKFED